MNSTDRKLKVALMSYSMDNRKAKGIALYTRKLITGLLNNPSNDYYLVHFDQVTDPLYQKAREIIMPKFKLPYGSRFISLMLFFWKYRNDPFDVVHWFAPRVYPFYWLVPAKKIIVTVHGAGDITAPTHFVFSRMVFNFVLKYFQKWIDVIIVDSNYAKNEVMENYNFPEFKVKTIYLGGGEVYQPINKESVQISVLSKYKITQPYILDISRLQPHKNVGVLIRAYILMREGHGDISEKLVIVGGQAYKNRVEYELAEKSNFSNDIIFVDFVDFEDLNTIYSASELFVFPSLNEGFGLPVLEAMASGVPVITSNVTSMPEIGGDAVVTIDPLNIDELAESMHKVLKVRSLQEKMIKLGLIRASLFTWDKTVRQTEELYK
jgi:glycosyltransferase involved in cell wall biosynthesis